MNQEDAGESHFQMERVPSDVLEDIFHFASPNGAINDTLSLSHVSRSWRVVCLGQRALWLTIRVKLGADFDTARKYWSTMRRRTRGAGVTIEISDMHSDADPILWWIQASPVLFGSLKNIHAVSVTLLSTTKPLPVLKVLRHIPVSYHTLIIHGFAIKLPNESRVEVCMEEIYAISPDIKRIELHSMNFFLKSVFARLPVEELVIHVPDFETSRTFIDGILVQCPHLRILEIIDGKDPEDTYFGTLLSSPTAPAKLESFVVDRMPHMLYSSRLNQPCILPCLTKLLVHRPDRDRSKIIAFVRENPTIVECGFTFAWETVESSRKAQWLTLEDLAGVAPQMKTLHIFAKYCNYDFVLLLDEFNTQRTKNPSSFFPNLVTLHLDDIPFLSKVLFEDLVQACYPTALPGASSSATLTEFSVKFKDTARENEKMEWTQSEYLQRAEIYKMQARAQAAWHVSWS